jgi:serine/threonine protein kinase
VIEVATRVADRYRIDARLGGGGMADVFEARDEALDRDVAIKLLRGIDDEAAARRFAEEIRLTARLNHPNVVRLFDAGEHEGSPYLVLERVTGGTLSSQMADGPVDPQRVADIGRQVADALEHAHSEGIVHRDVKPSNILLTADGTVRLADFGIALTATATRLTVAGSVAGSAGYVSPEQVLGTGAGAASDVYALGLVLLECLTGEPPWSGTTVEVALARITADPPMPATVPAPWLGLLTAMTARRPEDRPTMAQVGAALTELAAGRDTELFPLPVPPPDRRLRVASLVAGVLLLAAASAVAGVVQWRSRPAPQAAPTAAAVSDVPSTPMDGLIAASAVRGAAVGETAPDTQPAADDARSQRRQREADRPRTQPRDSGQGSSTSSATASGGSTTSTTSAPRTTTTSPRETTTGDTTPTTSTPTSGGDTQTSTDSGDSGTATEDEQTAEDVIEETAKGNGKGRGPRDKDDEDVRAPARGSSQLDVVFPDGRAGR